MPNRASNIQIPVWTLGTLLIQDFALEDLPL